MTKRIVFGIGLGLLVVLGFFGWRFLQSDTCLDRGGRWIQSENRCEYCYGRDGTFHADEICERYQPESMPDTAP